MDFKNNKPKVSIITITFNSKAYLETAIKSVLAQDYSNIEYIIIDGGSTDGTVDIIQKYKDKISYWVSERDEGISDAFNKGIKAANGELIGLLNSDDWYEDGIVSKVIESYLSQKEQGVFHGDLRFHQSAASSRVIKPADDPRRILGEMIYNHPTCFIPSVWYHKFGAYRKDLKIAMDYELLLRFYLKGVKFCYIPEVLTNMRATGICNKDSSTSMKEVFKINREYGLPYHKACYLCAVKMIKHFLLDLFGRDSFIARKYRGCFKR